MDSLYAWKLVYQLPGRGRKVEWFVDKIAALSRGSDIIEAGGKVISVRRERMPHEDLDNL